MKKLCFTILAFAIASSIVRADAAAENPISQATIRTSYVGKKDVETKRVKLQETEKGVWRFRIPKEELIGKNIAAIEVVSDAAVAKKGEEGYFVGSNLDYGTFRADDGKYANRRNAMSMFGMKNPRGTFVGIVKGLDCEYETAVEAKKGVYEVFPRFLIEKIEFPAYEDLVVDFHELKGADADYAGMARKYRDYQIGRGEVVPLKERIKDNPKLAYATQSILMRFAHGGKGRPTDEKGKVIGRDYTLDTELPMGIGWTFADEKKAIEMLHEMGVKEAVFHDVGWNIRGHDGRYPQLFPVEPALGGEVGLRDTIKTAKDLGYQISCHTNQTDAYKIADCWSEEYISKYPNGSLQRGGVWAGGQSYIPCPEALYNRFAESDYKKIKDLGYNGLHHVDVISAVMPNTCHDPKHPLNRREWSQWQQKSMKLAHDIFGGFTSECGVDHVAKYLDFALYVSHYPTWMPRKYPLVDGVVPTWQIAYHGIILSNPFWETIAYTLQKPEEEKVNRLKLIEYGGIPCFYGGTNLKNLDKVKKAYDDFQPLKYLQLEFMQEHKQLAEGVFLTVYGDGSETVVNYTDKDFKYKGRTVAPYDYVLVKPGLWRQFKNWISGE